ncbi:MAG: adenylate/guanylate cyclase domain-containing protein [Candidatus Limnocylindrales bacterium]
MTTTRGFVFADLRGYTDYVERKGDAAAAALLARYRLVVRAVVDRHEGAEVRTEGDSFYILFPSASRAVAAALEIVAAAAAGSTDSSDDAIRVGVGVHAGETADTDEGPVGSAVNLAARICAQAKAGEVLVSDTVRGLTRTGQTAVFESAGTRRLKGIAEPIALYRALPVGTAIRPVHRGRIVGALGGGRGGRAWIETIVGLAALGGLVILGFTLLRGFGPGQPSPSPSNVSLASDPPAEVSQPGAQTVSPPTADTSPSIAPVEGTRIIYSRQVPSQDGACDGAPLDAKLYVIDPETTSATPYRLTYGSNLLELDPAWSADGSAIGFIASIGRGPKGLAVLEPDGEEVNMVVEPFDLPGISFSGPTNVAISAAGDTVIHAGRDSLFRTDIGRSNVEEIAGVYFQTAIPTESFRDMAYLPDGSLLVLVAPFNPEQPDNLFAAPPWLETMAADGSGRELVEFDLGDLVVRGIAIDGTGERIALDVIDPRDGTTSIHVGELVSGPDSLEQVVEDLEFPARPEFSPDGDQIVVQAGGATREQLYVIDLATGEQSQLTDDPEFVACSPVWRDAPSDLAAQRLDPWASGEPRLLELGLLPAGKYVNEVVQPTMAFDVPEGWYARRSYIDGWSLARPDGPPGVVDYVRPQIGFSDPCEDAESVIIGPRTNDLIDYFQNRDDLVVTSPAAINIGGYSGVVVDVRGRGADGCGEDAESEYWILFSIEGDSVALYADDAMKMIALDVEGTTLAFQVSSSETGLEEYWGDHARTLLNGLSFPRE